MTNAAKATAWPTKTRRVIPVAEKDMTGGTRMTVQHDPAGFDFAQIKVKLFGEPEDPYMNPKFAEIGYTLKPEEAGNGMSLRMFAWGRW